MTASRLARVPPPAQPLAIALSAALSRPGVRGVRTASERTHIDMMYSYLFVCSVQYAAGPPPGDACPLTSGDRCLRCLVGFGKFYWRVGYQSWRTKPRLPRVSTSPASTRSSHPASKEMSDAVIDLCTSDSDNEESPRPTSSAKRSAAGPPQVDSDSDDCFVCPPPAPAAAGASSSSNIATVAQEEQQEDGDGDGDIEYV